MKKIILSFTLAILFGTLAFYSCDEVGPVIIEEPEENATTVLRIKNSNPTDTATIYLTLSPGNGWVSDVNGMFGISSTNKLQGNFTLNPGDSLTYQTPNGLALSGNFSFGYPPINCPVGITLYEFTINNGGTIKYAQETVEISCVAGVSSLGKYTLYNDGGGKWEANPNYMDVRSFHNDSMGENTGLVGVYPYGCTNCTDTAGKPDCIINPETPQSQSICNVSRDANKSGGTIKIEYLGLINNSLKRNKK